MRGNLHATGEGHGDGAAVVTALYYANRGLCGHDRLPVSARGCVETYCGQCGFSVRRNKQAGEQTGISTVCVLSPLSPVGIKCFLCGKMKR